MSRALVSEFRSFPTGHSKSSVVTPLIWTLIVLLTGLLAAIGEQAPGWVWIFFAAAMGATVLLMIGIYVYAIVRNPGVLRSERYTFTKPAEMQRENARGSDRFPPEAAALADNEFTEEDK